MNYKERYEEWLNNDFFDAESRKELEAIRGDEKEIEDRFYQTLSFGTAGLRGVMGAGTNRMNIYTVTQASEGFARLFDVRGEAFKKLGVAIGYDVRHHSREFAQATAEVFAAHGIHVYLHRDIVATPVLSYTIRKLHTYGGVMVTASHNPPQYNGYKAYNSYGSQILDDWAREIEENISQLESYDVPRLPLEEGVEKGIIEYVPDSLYEDYYNDVLSLTLHDGEEVDKSISMVYSPYNGCGNIPVRTILKRRGFHHVHVVEEQERPDPDFSTLPSPNPEVPASFQLAEKLGKEVGADVLIATDPDSDRLALEVADEGGSYHFLSGNRTGMLLVNYIVTEKAKAGQLPKNGAIIKSIVTGDNVRPLAEKYGLAVMEVLTGFKNIAEPMNEWDSTGDFSYVFGYEESIGFNAGSFVRDKDAVSSAMLLAEMAGFYKKQGKTLLDVMNAYFDQYGCYGESQKSTYFEGISGHEKIGRIMEDFRKNPIQQIGDHQLVRTIDYLYQETGLADSNVLKYYYDDGSWYAIRPSGTEPKIKVYSYAVGKSQEEADAILEALEGATTDKMAAIE